MFLARLRPDIPSERHLFCQHKPIDLDMDLVPRPIVDRAYLSPLILEHTRAPTPSQRGHCNAQLGENHQRYAPRMPKHTKLSVLTVFHEPVGGSICTLAGIPLIAKVSSRGISLLSISSRSENASQYSSSASCCLCYLLLLPAFFLHLPASPPSLLMLPASCFSINASRY